MQLCSCAAVPIAHVANRKPQPKTQHWRQLAFWQWTQLQSPQTLHNVITSCAMAGLPQARRHLTVLSANVLRDFLTSIGDLTYNFILLHNVDIVLTTETWLDEER